MTRRLLILALIPLAVLLSPSRGSGQGEGAPGPLPEQTQILMDQYLLLKDQSLTLIEKVRVLQQDRQRLLDREKELQKALEASQKSKEEVENQYITLAETMRGVQQDRRKVMVDQSLAQKMIKSLEVEVEVLKRRQTQLEPALQRAQSASRNEQAQLKEALKKLNRMQTALKTSEEHSVNLQLEVVEARSLAREGRIAFNYELGRLYAKHGEYDTAIAEFQKTLTIDPNYAEAYRQLGEIYAEHLMRADLASPYFRRYLELRPEASDFGQIKGWLLKQKKEIETHKAAAEYGGGFFHTLARLFW